MLRLAHLSALVVATLVVGCTGAAFLEEPPPTDFAMASPVVVAIIDSGVNPYHTVFQAGLVDAADLDSGVGAVLIELATEGSVDARLSADSEIWGGLEKGRLYAFSGTRIMAISFGSADDARLVFDTSPGPGHGTAVAGIIANEAPSALLVVIQIDNVICGDGGPCPRIPQMAEAMAWAAKQPWIDVISVSQGFPANPPMHLLEDAGAYLKASRAASESGKVLIAGAGNTVTPTLTSHIAGPPWVISVGGFEGGGESSEASKLVDVVADYTVEGADATSTSAFVKRSGTSFSAPAVAATLAEALAISRDTLDRCEVPPNLLLRGALNATALSIPLDAWQPRPKVPDPADPPSSSIPVVVPGAQGGWGLVHSGIVEALVASASSCEPIAQKGSTDLLMWEFAAARSHYWATG